MLRQKSNITGELSRLDRPMFQPRRSPAIDVTAGPAAATARRESLRMCAFIFTVEVVLAEGVLDLDGATERCDDPLCVLQAFLLGATRHRDPPPPLGPAQG